MRFLGIEAEGRNIMPINFIYKNVYKDNSGTWHQCTQLKSKDTNGTTHNCSALKVKDTGGTEHTIDLF